MDSVTEVVSSAGLAIGALCSMTVISKSAEVLAVELTLRS